MLWHAPVSMQVYVSSYKTALCVPSVCLIMQDRTHTLKSFASSADWIKSLHFGDPKPTADPSAVGDRSSKRRKLGSYTGPEPSIEEIEGEFWRVIEAPDDVSTLFAFTRLLVCANAAVTEVKAPTF